MCRCWPRRLVARVLRMSSDLRGEGDHGLSAGRRGRRTGIQTHSGGRRQCVARRLKYDRAGAMARAFLSVMPPDTSTMACRRIAQQLFDHRRNMLSSRMMSAFPASVGEPPPTIPLDNQGIA